MREQMRQLVPQSAIDLSRAVFAKPRVQRYALPVGIGPACRRLEPGVPFDRYGRRQPIGAGRAQNLTSLIEDRNLGESSRFAREKIETQLLKQQHNSLAIAKMSRAAERHVPQRQRQLRCRRR